MLVNLKSDSVAMFSNDYSLMCKYSENIYKTRDWIKKFLNFNKIDSYVKFKLLINTVAPYEDDEEIYRFWYGYFFSEYFVELVYKVVSKFTLIDISPFQKKRKTMCLSCGSEVLKSNNYNRGKRN